MAIGNRFPVLVFGLGFSIAGLYPKEALSCGGGGITSTDGLVVNAQRVVISSREAGTTDIVAQITVPRTTSNYGMLIPVPSEPTLSETPVSAEELDTLDAATAPLIVIDEGSSDEPLIGCGSTKLGGGPPTRAINAGPPVEIGPVVAVTLKGDSVADINNWLNANGFVLPSANTTTLERYVSAGSYFIAIKRSESAASGAPSSIGIQYSLTGDHRMLSLAFAQIGADSEVGFTLFLVTKTATGPSAPFKALTLKDLDGQLLSGTYQDAVRKAVADNDSKAFVLESVTPVSELTPSLPKLAALFDQDAVVTRATTLIARADLTTDAMFATPIVDAVPESRTIMGQLVTEPPSLHGLWSSVVMVGAAVSFSLRRRKS